VARERGGQRQADIAKADHGNADLGLCGQGRGETTVLVDSGIRSGLDLVRMLALGAEGVLLGRAITYALAAKGQAGVAHVLELIGAEMRVAMALSGVRSVKEIDRNVLVA